MSVTELATIAKAASIKLAAVNTKTKNVGLAEIAEALKENSAQIIATNKEDLAEAEADNLAAPLLKRLKFDEQKIADCIASIDSLIKLGDPVGNTLDAIELDDGLELLRGCSKIEIMAMSMGEPMLMLTTLSFSQKHP